MLPVGIILATCAFQGIFIMLKFSGNKAIEPADTIDMEAYKSYRNEQEKGQQWNE
jgi:hypothetical protein